jgi:hypothetical protein
MAVLSALATGSAEADVYKYVDSRGQVYYTDKPQHAGFRMILRTPPPFSLSAGYAGGDGVIRLGGRRSGARPMSASTQRNRRQYEPLIEAAASRYSLDPALLHAVIRAESGYNPEAVSNKGAAGLMQLMPATASRFGVRDRFDPVENIDGGARYLSELIGMFASDVRLAVAAYNSGENTVKKYGNQVPPIAETRTYVERVLNYYGH